MPTDPSQGGKCQPGAFCPGRTDAPISCPGGFYCATDGLAAPTAECNQGTVRREIMLRERGSELQLYFRNLLFVWL